MSLYGALFTGVSGLKSQSNKIGAISDNIANVNTIGYKAIEAQFETLVISGAGSGAYSPGGALPNNRLEIDNQGLLIATDAPTDIAVSGGGFFVVNSAVDGSDTPAYTRAGSFRTDELGNFKNAAGFYLQGWALDRDGKIPATSANLDSLQTVNVESATGIANATTSVDIGANFDASEDVFPGQEGTVTMDSVSSVNYGISADDIIAPAEYNLATTNSITRYDKFTITTGNGLVYDYEYGGFTIGRDVTTAGAGNVGDAQNDVTATTTLGGGEIVTAAGSTLITMTIANHGLITGDTITLAGFGAALDGIPAAELNTVHTITRVDANTITFNTTTAAVAGGVNNPGGETLDTRQYSGNIFDASTASQAFFNNIGVGGFTSGALTFSITTPTVGTTTFRYVTSSPSAVAGEFNNLNNLATAIDEVVGLTARVEGGRIMIGSEDANEAVTFANGDDTGTSTLRGIDWITELDVANVSAGSDRFSTLQGLANQVNLDEGVSAALFDPLAATTLEIRVDDPLDTIQFDDFVQDPPTRLSNDALTSAAGGPGLVSVTVTDNAHGFVVGQSITLSGVTAFDAFTVGELNTTHTITQIIDANTYVIAVNSASANAGATGGGNAIDRARVNNGSLLAELGLVDSLNGAAYTAQTTGVLGPRYDSSGSVGDNMASGDIEAQFSRSVRVYDALGAPHDIRMDVIKIAENQWAMELYVEPEDDISTTLVDGQIAVGTVTFNGDGTLRSVSSGLSSPITINWTNGSVASTITFDWGTAGQPIGTANATTFGDTDGLSQFSSNFNVSFVNQNGAPVGELIAVNINEEGIVTASFSNGETQDLFKIPLADFSNPNGMSALSGNVYLQTRDSGEVNLREAGTNGTGTVVSGTLEASSVKLDEQLTDMIVAQRAYQSNTRSISTADDLLEELNRL